MGYAFAVNQPCAVGADIGESAAYLYLRHKAILTAELSNVARRWTVPGSSNSVTAGMDGADRLSTTSNIVTTATGGAAHSWCVTKDSLGLSILFDWSAHATDRRYAKIYMSPSAGFTGGSITARPTATDEVAVDARDDFLWASAGATNSRWLLNVIQRDDGLETYAVGFKDNLAGFFWATFRADQIIPGWTLPQTACIGNVSGHCDRLRARGPSGQANVKLTVESSNGQPFFRYVCKGALGVKRYLEAPGLWSETVGMKSRYGRCRRLFVCGAYNAGFQPDGMDEGKTAGDLGDITDVLIATEDNAGQNSWGAMAVPWPKGSMVIKV